MELSFYREEPDNNKCSKQVNYIWENYKGYGKKKVEQSQENYVGRK